MAQTASTGNMISTTSMKLSYLPPLVIDACCWSNFDQQVQIQKNIIWSGWSPCNFRLQCCFLLFVPAGRGWRRKGVEADSALWETDPRDEDHRTCTNSGNELVSSLGDSHFHSLPLTDADGQIHFILCTKSFLGDCMAYHSEICLSHKTRVFEDDERSCFA